MVRIFDWLAKSTMLDKIIQNWHLHHGLKTEKINYKLKQMELWIHYQSKWREKHLYYGSSEQNAIVVFKAAQAELT